jgi:hypothetical protein
MLKTILFALLLISLTGAGATGAYMISDGFHWTGGHHMMGDGDGHVDCTGLDGEHPEDCTHKDYEECQEHDEECGEHLDDCGHEYRGMGC